jgi:hypothetical protein
VSDAPKTRLGEVLPLGTQLLICVPAAVLMLPYGYAMLRLSRLIRAAEPGTRFNLGIWLTIAFGKDIPPKLRRQARMGFLGLGYMLVIFLAAMFLTLSYGPIFARKYQQFGKPLDATHASPARVAGAIHE